MNDPGEALCALLWRAPAPPKRGPRPTLTLDAIARVGIAIADAEGLAALTMQRVAAALGVSKMALYRYVPGKAELVALMIDIGVGTPAPSRARSWRPALVAWSHQLFDSFYRHPWSFAATLGPRIIGPNELNWLEYACAVLAKTPLDGAEKIDVAVTLVGHIRNVAAQLTAVPTDSAGRAIHARLPNLLRGHEARFPAVTAALASARESGVRGKALDFGLERILDGVASLIDARTSAQRARRSAPTAAPQSERAMVRGSGSARGSRRSRRAAPHPA